MAKVGTFNLHLERYTRNLAIIVPYRDRLDYLKKFMPHMSAYFERDKLDRYISVSFNVIEQVGDKPFNRGKIKNCGFALLRMRAIMFAFTTWIICQYGQTIHGLGLQPG